MVPILTEPELSIAIRPGVISRVIVPVAAMADEYMPSHSVSIIIRRNDFFI
jgi:hypothetical protein